MDSKIILITGATGLLGTKITNELLGRDFTVRHLVRNPERGSVQQFKWDLESGEMDAAALENVYAVIHLAGENVGEKLWTNDQKKKIIDSRLKSSAILLKAISKMKNPPEKFIAASASGYYGAVTGTKIFTESDLPGNDFLAKVCVDWEKANSEMINFIPQTYIFRIGVVMAKEGGALPKLLQPMRFLAGTILGSGKQFMPWIHIDDLAGIVCYAVEADLKPGIYNAAAPEQVTHAELIKTAAEIMHRFVSPIHVPEFALKAMLGEQSVIVNEGSRVSVDKIIKAGYNFRFSNIRDALKNLIN